MKLEEMLTIGSLDIELAYWWTANPLMYLAAFVSDKCDVIYGVFDIPQDEFVSNSGRIAKYVRCENDTIVRNGLGRLMAEKDLAVIGGQNILGFDYDRLDRKGDMIFMPGSDNSPAFKTGTRIGIFERWRNNTSADLDTMLIARNYLQMFLADAKLETIAELIDYFSDQVNIHFVKTHTHEQLDEAAERALAGSVEDAIAITKYNYEDTIAHYELTKFFVPIMVNIARATQSELFSAFNDTKTKLTNNYAARKHFRLKHQLMHPLEKKRYSKFKLDNERKKMLKAAIPGLKAKKGLFKGLHLFHMPFYLIADSVHQKDSVKRVHLSRIKEASNIVEKVMYSQIMDSYTAEVMSDCHEAASNNAFNFNEKYNKSHEDVRKAMHSMLKELVLGIDAKSVANFSNSLLFMHNADQHGLVSRGYTSIGEVNLISVEERRVIYEQNGIIFASGIQIPSKKEREKLDYGNSKHGRTNIETIVIRDFIEGLFNDREEAYSQLCSYVEDAAKLRFDLKYYIKAINVRSNLENMSDTELMKEDKQIIRHFKAKQDETVMSIQTVKGYAGYDPGEKKFFLMENGERKYIGDDEVRKILDMGYYREKIFGQKSRLYSLMKVAFDKKTRQHFKDHVNACFTNSVA